MGYNYKPQNGSLASKLEIEKYESALDNFDTYIQNLIESYGYLLSKVDLNNNELAYQHGLVNEHDVSWGRELNVPSFIEKHLKEYTDELIKRAHLIGHAGGDITGATWAITQKEKKDSEQRAINRSNPNKSTEQRDKYFFNLVNNLHKEIGDAALELKPEYYRNLYKKKIPKFLDNGDINKERFNVDMRSLNNSINAAKKKINGIKE